MLQCNIILKFYNYLSGIGMRFARHNPAFLGGRGVVVSLILIDHKLYRGITFFLPSIDDHPITCYSVSMLIETIR